MLLSSSQKPVSSPGLKHTPNFQVIAQETHWGERRGFRKWGTRRRAWREKAPLLFVLSSWSAMGSSSHPYSAADPGKPVRFLWENRDALSEVRNGQLHLKKGSGRRPDCTEGTTVPCLRNATNSTKKESTTFGTVLSLSWGLAPQAERASSRMEGWGKPVINQFCLY